MRKVLLQVVAPPLIAALLVAGLILLGRAAGDRLRHQQRYTIALLDLDCPAPPGQSRTEFLGEVQYLSDLPDRLSLLDADLGERLSRAFSRHPWVEKVEQVRKVGSSQVQVRLAYRTPVLAVLLWGPPPDGRQVMIQARSSRVLGTREAFLAARAVDAAGTLLPASAPLEGLPVLYSKTAAPAGPAGTPWGDAAVTAAARTADYLRPHQDHLGLEDFEMVESGLVLSTPPAFQVLWGQPPGSEAADEAPAAVKLERLLEYGRQHDGLGHPDEPCEHDVRPRAEARHQPQSFR